MEQTDVLVIGAGISGASMAHWCAKGGRRVKVIDKDDGPGGCMRSRRLGPEDGVPQGFWWELGAHTCYNSYGALIDLLGETGGLGLLLPRQKAPFRLLVGDRLRSIPSQLAFLELALSAPRLLVAVKTDRSVREFYGPIVGQGNYARVFSPLFAAVPSQPADDFPAEMLFKKRPRRKEILRSFTLQGGLQTAVERALATPGVTLETRAEVTQIRRDEAGYVATLHDGRQLRATALAVAAPPSVAATLLAEVHPALAGQLAKIATQTVQSLGVTVAKAQLSIERVAGIVPQQDVFYSAVSRDVVDDPLLRGFTFHLRPGVSRDQALARIAVALGCAVEQLQHITARQVQLPSPVVGHAQVMAEVEKALHGGPAGLYLAGNYFGGLAIEDCVLRARAEAQRLLAGTALA